MSFIKEFKAFALRGNVIDLAVGVIIGAAFHKIVTSLVNDILMPLFGLLMGGVSFNQLFYSLDGREYLTLVEAEKAGAGVLKYGSFIQAAFDFLIIAFVIFLVVKSMQAMQKKATEEKSVESPEDIKLLREIRDSLKK